MSMAVRHIPWISPDEYLDQEQMSSTRHMYCAGVVTAMAGGSLSHGMLAMNLGAELRAALRGRGCRVVGSDVLIPDRLGRDVHVSGRDGTLRSG